MLTVYAYYKAVRTAKVRDQAPLTFHGSSCMRLVAYNGACRCEGQALFCSFWDLKQSSNLCSCSMFGGMPQHVTSGIQAAELSTQSSQVKNQLCQEENHKQGSAPLSGTHHAVFPTHFFQNLEISGVLFKTPYREGQGCMQIQRFSLGRANREGIAPLDLVRCCFPRSVRSSD